MTGDRLDVRQLEYFLAIVDHGGMSRAAIALHVAQPSLSQAIKSLERDLGAQVFHRAGRRLVLSAAGEALIEPARQALRDLATARASVAAVVDVMAGSLDITAVPTLAVDPLASLVGAFRGRFPKVSVRLHEPETAVGVALRVREGESELGLTPLPVARGGLRVRVIGAQDLVVVAPPGLVGDPARPLSIAELQDLPMVASPAGTSTRALLDTALAAIDAEPWIAVESAAREAIVPLVLSGAGATLLPRPLADEAARRGAQVYETRPAITRQIGVVSRPGPISPAGAAFMAMLPAPG